MAAFLGNLRNVVIVSFVLAFIFIYAYLSAYGGKVDMIFLQAVFRWLHVIVRDHVDRPALVYFNFVQTRMMPQIPNELKPGVSKYIAPEALFWFRWAAAFTLLMGIVLAWSRGFLAQAYSLGFMDSDPTQRAMHALMGIGMWLGTIMAFNVWVFIWPNQKIALGIVEADADAKAKAAKIAGQFSRINTLLSIPMLVAMTMQQTVFG